MKGERPLLWDNAHGGFDLVPKNAFPKCVLLRSEGSSKKWLQRDSVQKSRAVFKLKEDSMLNTSTGCEKIGLFERLQAFSWMAIGVGPLLCCFVSDPFRNRFGTVPGPFQNRSRTVLEPFQNRSPTVPEPRAFPNGS